ncbi:hypothetical protein Tco_1429581 [Tanacetum coccineum]
MQHPVDGRAWKDFDTKYLDFAAEPRNVRLGLAADSFNPFGNLSQSYNMWPDQKGVETIDVASGHKFNMRAMVLWTINDFLARSSLFGWSRQGYKTRPTCNEDTPSVRKAENPPRNIGRDQIQAQLARLPTRVKGKHPSYGGVKIKRNVLVELNWTKRSIFYELEYWSFLTLKHNLDIMHIEKNVLEAILNTLLMNDKSKDTAKARQDLKKVGFEVAWAWPNKTGSARSLRLWVRIQLQAPKIDRNDTNITCLKSHDCHIMMQRLLPYGLQQYLPDEVAKPIIDLCSLFKQICSATLMEDDMLKAQIKVVDILYELELIYPPALFDIMVHLVIHLPIKALEDGPIRPQWMYPFERYMKKLKGYFDAQELKKVKWYVLHNSPEIDTYRSQFKSLFPNKDMQEEFPDWFGSQIRQRHVDNDQDPEVSTTSELFALANGPSWTPISVNSCVVDGVRYVVHSRDERRTTQNSGICSPGPDGEMYYGQLQEILEFKYLLFKVALFRVKWFDTSNKGRKVNKLVLRNNMTQIDCSREAFKDDQYILVTQVKQVFYLEDKTKPHWKVVEHVNHKKFSDGGVIVVEDDPDIIHFDNSSDLPLSTSLNDLDNATLHIDGQSTVVDAPPDIIDVPDEDDDIIDDEDALPHDLADSDVEDLINVDDDGVEKMSSADVARSHGGDGGGDDRPPSHVVPTGCGGCFANKGKGKRKPNLGGRGAGRLNTRDKTRNLSLKEIAVAKGPVPINFEQGDKQTLNPLGPHAAHWSNYIGEVVRSVPLYYPSWEKVPKERKAAIISEIGTQFDLKPYIQSELWPEIRKGIDQHLGKIYTDNKSSLKRDYWVKNPDDETYDEKSTVVCRQGSQTLVALRDRQIQSFATQEYPSLIQTFFDTHTVGGVFLRDEDRRLYHENGSGSGSGAAGDDEDADEDEEDADS